MAFLFRVLRKTDQKTAKNGLEWRMDEVMGIVCGAMFGEERVNNSVDLLSRVLFAFSVGQISALVTVTHFCCNLLLQMLECYWTCSHARLACFLFETNQHFVGSARIAGLCLTDEVELEQSWQEGRLVWSVKIRRVRFTRCVFRYGPRDGMTWEVAILNWQVKKGDGGLVEDLLRLCCGIILCWPLNI